MAGTPLAEAFVRIRADGSQFKPDVDKVMAGTDADGPGQKTGDRAGKGFVGGFGKSLAKVGGVMAGAFAGIAVAGFLKDSISAASDLSETVNKANVIFGEGAPKIQAWASTAASSFGLSKQEALEAAAGMGNMLTQLGYTGEAAMQASTGTVQLAADLGSFNNLATGDVLDRIGAAMRGEYDSLQLLIPNINAARVEQEALAMSGKSVASELTAQEKAAATLAIVQRDGAAAANDFAETSGGLANQQKILSANFENIKATVGAGLVPVLAAGAGMVNTFLTQLQTGEGIGGRVGAAFSALGAALGTVGTWITANVLPALQSFFGSLSGGGGALTSFGAAIAPIVRVLMDLGSRVLAVVGPALSQIVGLITGSLIPAFLRFVPAVAPFVAFFLNVVGGAVVGALKGLVSIVQGVLNILSGIFNVFAGLLSGNWRAAWEGIKQIATGVFQAIIGAVQVFLNVGILRLFSLGMTGVKVLVTGGFNAVKALFTSGMAAAQGIAARALSAIVNFFRSGLSSAVSAVQGGINTVRAIFSSGMAVAQALVRAALTAIANFFRSGLATAQAVVSGAINAIRGAFSSGLNAVVGVARSALASVVAAIRSGVSNAVGAVRALPGSVLGALGNMGSMLFSKGAELIQGLIRGITSKISAVRNAIGQVTSAVGRFLPGSPVKEGPLRVLNNGYAGGLISQMVADGVMGNAGVVRKAMSELGAGAGAKVATAVSVPVVPAVPAPRVAATGAAGNAPPSWTLALNGPVYAQDVEALARELETLRSQASRLAPVR